MSPMLPTAIRRVADASIEITWNDGVTTVITPRLLRDACPCAICRERRADLPVAQAANPLAVLKPEEIAPLAITGMIPIGQYAYKIAFTDGHDSGLYTMDYLRELTAAPR